MPAKNKLKPLLIVSVFIVISDLLFIAINYNASLNAVHADTKRWADEVRHVFALTLDAKSTSMQQLASFVANMPRAKELFHQASIAQGQNPRGENALRLSSLRSQLYNLVKPSWETMAARYDVRQLHFHFGPGSTSFLRVHRPEKFGDNMDQVRFTVVDVNSSLQPTKGFETGRVYSGIRGVVPVVTSNRLGQTLHVGALEAGTSFTGMLQTLRKELDCEIAVLLTSEHVSRNMWPEFVERHFGDDKAIDDFYVESATTPDARRFLMLPQVRSLTRSQGGSDFIPGDRVWQVGAFPLRDYRGTIDPALPHSGVVVIWKEATEAWNLVRQSLWTNIFYALAALAIVECVLIIGWRLSQRHLNRIIRRQTRKLRKMATLDGLTGLLNRRTIESALAEEVSRNKRHDSPFSVIMFDIDHFKKVNDTYGHNAGDEVLKKVSRCVTNLVRTTDKVGRWGGEEFLVLALQTPLDEAMVLAERMREAIAAMHFTKAAPVTVSLGAAQHQKGQSGEALVQRADTALYQAKEGGRNQSVAAR